MSIKTVVFTPNYAGIDSIKIDTSNWTVWRTCTALPALSGRHCRLSKSGTRLEYRDGSGYQEVPANIKEIS